MSGYDKVARALVIGSGFHRFVFGDIGIPARLEPLVDWHALIDRVALEREVPGPPREMPPVMRWEEIVRAVARGSENTPPSRAEKQVRSTTCDVLRHAEDCYPKNERTDIPRDSKWGTVISLNFDLAWCRDEDERDCGNVAGVRPAVESARLGKHLLFDAGGAGEQKTDERRAAWFPNGSTRYPNTIRMGLRDYGFQSTAINQAVNLVKRWERRIARRDESPQGKYERVCDVLRGDSTEPEPPRTWVTDVMFRPLVFLGVGLSEQETGLWWLLAQRARNMYRLRPAERTPAFILLHADDPRRSFWEHHPFGITPVFCTSWARGWEKVLDRVFR